MLRAAIAVAACLLLPERGIPQERASGALPPGRLPATDPVAQSEAAALLNPTADSDGGPPTATRSLMQEPARATMHAWFDLPHAFVERRLFDVGNGFDRFFADERDLDFFRSSSFLRWRNEVRLTEGGKLTFGTSVAATFSFPYLEKRLNTIRIVFENAGRGLTDLAPPGIAQRDTERGDAVVRWTLFEALRSTIDIGGGFILKLPPGLVARTRFRYAQELGSVALARVAAVGSWNTLDGLGFRTSLSLERPLVRRLMLRWTAGTLVSQISNGYETGAEVALLATFGRTMALTTLGSVAAQSKPEIAISTWRVATRLRSALLRRWIFGEVEPEVTWPLDAAGGRKRVAAVMFRLEVQFEDEPPSARSNP